MQDDAWTGDIYVGRLTVRSYVHSHMDGSAENEEGEGDCLNVMVVRGEAVR